MARLEDGTPLATQPVEVELLGVEVPAGKHRVEVAISSSPEMGAGALAGAGALGLAFVALRPARRESVRNA